MNNADRAVRTRAGIWTCVKSRCDELPIADYALIGDCHTAALISRSGSIDWCCLPRFDSGSAFGRLLDREHGGHCAIAPADGGEWEVSREYLKDTLVLETTFSGPAGAARLIDCFTTGGASERQIVRVAEVTRGSMELQIAVAPRFDYGQVRPWIRRHGR